MDTSALETATVISLVNDSVNRSLAKFEGDAQRLRASIDAKERTIQQLRKEIAEDEVTMDAHIVLIERTRSLLIPLPPLEIITA